MRSRRLVGLGISLLLTACFDTEQVDPVRRVKIDDFEDGDEIASTGSGFGSWRCASYPTLAPGAELQEAQATCELVPGFASRFAESITFSLENTARTDFPGAILGVSSDAPTQDLGSFENLRFRANFEPGEPAPRDGTRLLSELRCPSADGPSDSPAPFTVVFEGELIEGVELPHGWSSYSLSLAAFRQPNWQSPLYEEASCLRVVDAIQFRIEPSLPRDGQAAAGKLTLDDVYLE